MRDFNLKSYAMKELELASSLAEENRHIERIDVLSFFPEFKDNLKFPYGNSLDPVIKIPTQLPFYETLIVGLSSFRDEYQFKKNYGVSVSEFIELYHNNRVIPILNGYPEDYQGLDYLYPLFNETLPPSIIRFRNGFDKAISEEKCAIYREKAKVLFKNKIEAVPSKTKYLAKTLGPADKVERGAMAGFIELNLVNADSAVRHIEELAVSHPIEAAGIINTVYRPLYADALYGSLLGNHALIKKKEYWNYCKDLPTSHVLFYPEDTGKSFVESLAVHSPKSIDAFKDADISYREARRALFALNREVSNLSKDELISRQESIKIIWEKINDITKREKHFSKVVQSIALVGPAALSLTGVPTLFEKIFPALAGTFAVLKSDKIGKKIARFVTPSSLIQVYDLVERIKGND